MKNSNSLKRTSMSLLLAGVLLATTGLSTAQGRTLQETASPAPDTLENAILSTMKVWILDKAGDVLGTCSSTTIDPRGYLLTNFHCVGHTRDEEDGAKGELYNAKGLVVLGPTLDERRAPRPTYVARFMAGDPTVDVAVLKIIGAVAKDQPLPNPLPLVVIQRADAETVRMADYIGIIGYPGVGGDMVTVTNGQIAGFEDSDEDGLLDAFKHDAIQNGGNSGGLAINSDGQQIGIPTFSISSADDGRVEKMSRAKMVNIAEPYIQQALEIGENNQPVAEPEPVAQPEPVQPSQPAQPSQAGFGDIQFGTNFVDGVLVDQSNGFPAGTTRVVAAVAVTGLQNGDDYGSVWYINDQVAAGEPTGSAWEGDGDGTYTFSLANDNKALPSARYKLELYIRGQVSNSAEFSIGGGKTKPPASQKPATQDTGVVLKGQLLDADTQQGIPNAVIVILKPGATFEQWDAAQTNEEIRALIAALGTADADGTYVTAPGLPRGQTYSAIVGAKGYSERRFENALEILDNDKALTSMSPIELQQK